MLCQLCAFLFFENYSANTNSCGWSFVVAQQVQESVLLSACNSIGSFCPLVIYFWYHLYFGNELEDLGLQVDIFHVGNLQNFGNELHNFPFQTYRYPTVVFLKHTQNMVYSCVFKNATIGLSL